MAATFASSVACSAANALRLAGSAETRPSSSKYTAPVSVVDTSSNSTRKLCSSSGLRCGSSSALLPPPRRNARGGKSLCAAVRIAACAASPESATDRGNVVEVVFDPHQRYHELVADMDSSVEATTPRNLTLFSPSKINVFLRVTSKRADGYHDLASLFHIISLGDVIKFSISPSKTKDSLTTNASGVPLGETNLIIKALNLYRKKTGSSTYFWVHLDKRVPTGAGLGGGSGNAATALWAANQISGGLATEKELQDWSGEIGSDIPVFFSQGAAYCTGRGEVVRDIPSPFDLATPMVLLKPLEECSTPEIFKKFQLSSCSPADPEDLLEKVIKEGITQSVCINDLEAPAFQVLPALKKFKDRISSASRGRYQAVFMSGSGSTIVGVGDPEPPQFVYDEDQYSDVFISEAYFVTRKENEWYKLPTSQAQDTSA